MPLPAGLTLWAYTLPAGTLANLPIVRRYTVEVQTLSFATTAPGGCATLQAALRLPETRVPTPDLGLLARVALMSPYAPLGLPHFCVWGGEITDPEIGLSAVTGGQDGDYVAVNALGLGNSLRDDPRDYVYTNQTIKQIVSNELSSRSATLPLDQDTGLIVPRTSSGFSPAYSKQNAEEVVTNAAMLDGDDMWGVWPHAVRRDVAGFPTMQLQLHARNTATVNYVAFEQSDVVSWRVTPSAQRAYNVVKIGYNDPGQTPPVGYAYAIDSRLTSSGSTVTGQGTAPFRPRVYAQDYSGIGTVTQAVAQSLANQYLALFQNVSNKIEIVLRGVRDAGGNPLPLHTVWADTNLLVPALGRRGNQLAVGNVAGSNLFYIVSTNYALQSDGSEELTLQCDNFVDTVAMNVARLQLYADLIKRQGQRTSGPVQSLGAPVTGHVGGEAFASAGSQAFGAAAYYGKTLTQLPSSITLTATVNSNVSGSPGIVASDYQGFSLQWLSAAAGTTAWSGTFATVGN